MKLFHLLDIKIFKFSDIIGILKKALSVNIEIENPSFEVYFLIEEVFMLRKEKILQYFNEDLFALDDFAFFALFKNKLDDKPKARESRVLFIKQILAELEKKTLQRIKSVPLAYIFKKASFDGNIFFVSKFVLIPRFDSEVLVESAADRFAEDLIGRSINSGKVINIADICSGSGCLGIAFCLRIMSILKKVKTDEERSIKLSVNLYFVDISKQALSVARKNFKNLIKNSSAINLLGFKIKARYINVDILKKEEVMHKIKTNFFDYILYNPPYIEKHAIKGLSKEVQKEPILALDGGVDGLKFYRIISRLRGYLKSDVRKRFFIEIGYNQKEAIESICAPLREPVCFKKDLGGNIRLAII